MRLISRAAAVLRALGDDPNGSSLGRIASATGLPRPTVQRLVAALAAEKLVVSDPGAGARLGPEILRLANAAHRDVTVRCRPMVERLCADVGETVDLTRLSGDTALVVHQAMPARALRVVSHVGAALPLHCTASGKAHLSRLEPHRVRAVLGGRLARYTDRTLVDVDAVLAVVAAGADGACWTDDEEFAPGVVAFALPLRTSGEGNYAVAVSMPKLFAAQKSTSVEAAILRCRDAIEVLTT